MHQFGPLPTDRLTANPQPQPPDPPPPQASSLLYRPHAPTACRWYSCLWTMAAACRCKNPRETPPATRRSKTTISRCPAFYCASAATPTRPTGRGRLHARCDVMLCCATAAGCGFAYPQLALAAILGRHNCMPTDGSTRRVQHTCATYLVPGASGASIAHQCSTPTHPIALPPPPQLTKNKEILKLLSQVDREGAMALEDPPGSWLKQASKGAACE